MAAWLSSWAIRSATDRVLEPSCGDGAFLDAAACRLEKVALEVGGGTHQLLGVEILEVEAAKARRRLVSRYGPQARKMVETGDFFAWWKRTEQYSFDAVIGNPPFIRYQSFPEPHRRRAMEIMKLLGLAPNRLTNVWVPFVAAVTASLRHGGRLALVLPAELLQVSYAAQLRSFLTDHFRCIHLVSCNELFFANAEQEVILLLADGARPRSCGSTCQVTMTAAATVAEIVDQPVAQLLSGASPKSIQHDSEKWLKYFLSNAEIGLMRALRASGRNDDAEDLRRRQRRRGNGKETSSSCSDGARSTGSTSSNTPSRWFPAPCISRGRESTSPIGGDSRRRTSASIFWI